MFSDDFQCLLFCTAVASIIKHYTFPWTWVSLYSQSFDPFFLPFPSLLPFLLFPLFPSFPLNHIQSSSPPLPSSFSLNSNYLPHSCGHCFGSLVPLRAQVMTERLTAPYFLMQRDPLSLGPETRAFCKAAHLRQG